MPSLREATPEAPAPVRAVANAVAQWIDRLGSIWVEGQIAQLNRRAGMGTVFLTLRDSAADISVTVTCARSLFDSLDPTPTEGMSIVVHARPNYYAPRGNFSLQAREIRLAGLGELLARLERRRQLLAAEGLFAAELKQPLPFLPRSIGLVTASGSAAERDVLEVARRRWPGVRFRTVYAAMQGHRAGEEILDALTRLDRDPDVDVIVLARGGGSVEDLLPFSDEALVRAVHQTRTPVVAAIGHDSDQPLLDLVADHRAATPTDAAKHVVPDVAEELDGLAGARERLRASVRRTLEQEQRTLDALRSRPALADPRSLLDERRDEVTALTQRARRTLDHRLERASDEIAHHRARARALSPLATLQRGYAVVQDEQGHVLSSVADTAPGETVSVRVADGRLGATVATVTSEDIAPSAETGTNQTSETDE